MSRRRRSSRSRHRRPGSGAVRRPGKQRNLQQAVTEYLEDRPNASFRMRDLVREFATSPAEEKEIRRVVHALHTEGRLRRIKGKRFQQIVDEAPRAIGPIDVTENGAGFVKVPGKDEDVFVAPSRRMGARNGDRVEVAITGRGRYGRQSGRVVRIVERDDTPIIGRYIALPGRGGMVYPDNPKIPGPIQVHEGGRRGARDNDRVQVKLDDFSHPPRGRVTRVFGPADDSSARFAALLAEKKFPEQFSQAAIDEAEGYTNVLSAEEETARTDFRDRLVITIDPASAKDFDDALSLRRLKNGNYELGVHIADVSWYVRPGSALEREARARATSVYSSHGTSPMLPEALSSDLCSLVEGEDRRTMSVLMTITPDGKVLHAQPHRSVIRSGKRLTYAEAQAMIDRGRKNWDDSNPPVLRKNSVRALIFHLANLARAMRRRRFAKGGLNLELPEYEVRLDDDNQVAGIDKKHSIEANHLVEECMLAANQAVTEFANHAREHNPRVFVYRIHDKPDPEKLQDLIVQLDALGLEWPFSHVHLDNIPSRQINEWLESIGDHPLGDIARYLVLRTMAKAAYDTENIGHYGLGFRNYTHFTSPIRRYPDLIVHRILNAILEGTTKYGPDVRDDLQRDCDLSSERERAAQDVERLSLKIRQAEYFARQIGVEFDGMIVGAIPKGVFVEIDDTGAQGLILADDLGSVYYDREVFGFVEITGERIFRPGVKVRVEVLEANPDTGRMELALVD